MIKLNDNLVEFKEFPNGETLLVKESLQHGLKDGKDNFVHFKYESDKDLIRLMILKKHLDNWTGMFDIKIALYIYYMPYSRMDRSEELSPFTLKLVAELINSLNFNSVYVIEPHSDVTPAVLDRAQSVFINFDLIERVKEEVGFDEDKDSIMFPDAGASKRYSKIKAKNLIIGNKQRDFETGKILGLDLIFNTYSRGKKVIIVDGLSSYGGTFVHSAKALREHGFDEIYLLVAHAENSIFKGELFDHIEKLFTTDSILSEQNNWEFKKFAPKLQVYSLEDYINENLK